MAYRCIYQLVYSRQEEGVFWTSFVQVRKVYTHSPFSILFLDHHSIGQSLRIENLLDSPCLLELLHLISDSIRVILG